MVIRCELPHNIETSCGLARLARAFSMWLTLKFTKDYDDHKIPFGESLPVLCDITQQEMLADLDERARTEYGYGSLGANEKDMTNFKKCAWLIWRTKSLPVASLFRQSPPAP